MCGCGCEQWSGEAAVSVCGCAAKDCAAGEAARLARCERCVVCLRESCLYVCIDVLMHWCIGICGVWCVGCWGYVRLLCAAAEPDALVASFKALHGTGVKLPLFFYEKAVQMLCQRHDSVRVEVRGVAFASSVLRSVPISRLGNCL